MTEPKKFTFRITKDDVFEATIEAHNAGRALAAFFDVEHVAQLEDDETPQQAAIQMPQGRYVAVQWRPFSVRVTMDEDIVREYLIWAANGEDAKKAGEEQAAGLLGAHAHPTAATDEDEMLYDLVIYDPATPEGA